MRITLKIPLIMVVIVAYSHSLYAVNLASIPTSIVTMGWLESVYIQPWGIRLTAKLDTGAKTSSLHARVTQHFTKNEAEWVRFELIDQETNRRITVEKPLVRTAYIKERKTGTSQRDVVMMQLCKNGKEYDTEITLVDRSNFNYPLLLGRSFLKGVAQVDSSSTFMYPAEQDECQSINKKKESLSIDCLKDCK